MDEKFRPFPKLERSGRWVQLGERAGGTGFP
jgi:hypothetical protein